MGVLLAPPDRDPFAFRFAALLSHCNITRYRRRRVFQQAVP